MRLELSVRNASAMVANFHAADAQLQEDIRDLVEEYGEATRELTSFLSPYRTGHMSESVRTVYSPSGLAFETGWDADDFIGEGLAFYPYFQEFGTRFMAAQPSLGPAYEEMRPQFERALRERVQQSIAELNRSIRGDAARLPLRQAAARRRA